VHHPLFFLWRNARVSPFRRPQPNITVLDEMIYHESIFIFLKEKFILVSASVLHTTNFYYISGLLLFLALKKQKQTKGD
jgi:hypothetical protein